MPVEILRRPARYAQQLREALERGGVLVEKREIGGAAADRFHELQAAREGRVRVFPRGGFLDDSGNQGVEAGPARLRQAVVARARAHRRKPRRGPHGIAKAELCQTRFGFLRADPQRRERVLRDLLDREHQLEMRGHAGAVPIERSAERIP